MTENRINFLVFGAHPDDAELGAGGTLVKLKTQGYKTGIVDMTRGEMGSHGDMKTREQEAKSAAAILKLDVRINLELPDSGLQNIEETRLKVINVIRKYRPYIVCCFKPDESRHPDHGNSGRIVKDSAFFAGLEKIETGLPPFRPDALIYYSEVFVEEPDFLVDVTEEWNTKIEAIRSYRSQIYDGTENEHSLSWMKSKAFYDAIVNRAKFYGSMIGKEYAEAFYYYGVIKINDLMKTFSR